MVYDIGEDPNSNVTVTAKTTFNQHWRHLVISEGADIGAEYYWNGNAWAKAQFKSGVNPASNLILMMKTKFVLK